MRHVKSTNGASKTRRAAGAGRVVLAAVVHYGSSSILVDGNTASKPKLTHSSTLTTRNPADKSSLKRLGKLFFSRRKQQTTATLIDDTPGAAANLGPLGNNSNPETTSCREAQQVPKQAKKKTHHSDRGREEVIEFKFDLIVDRKSGLKDSAPASFANEERGVAVEWKLAETLNELVGSSVLESNDVCVMSVGRQQVAADGCPRPDFTYIYQLAAHTLRYSFHLLEKSRLAQQASPNGMAGHWSPFEFCVEISASLVVLGEEAPTRRLDNSLEPPTPRLQIVDLVSGSTHDSGKQTLNGQLVSDCGESYPPRAMPLGGPLVVHGGDDERLETNHSVDCWTCDEALVRLAKVRDALASEPIRHLLAKTDKRILLIGLKLKQRINGGLFSNRISVIDFEPKFVELHSILESAFNGQALAYLKRQQQQQVAVSGSPLSPPFERRPPAVDSQILNTGRAQLISQGGSQVKDAEAKKDLLYSHHLNGSHEEESHGASRDALARAEWLLYKQLSSALIRTLLVVHVHKLDRHHSESSSITIKPDSNNKPLASPLEEQQLEQLELQLMADNLLALEFASSIQRASAIRLRRRKRHLRSHLASSNTSITSNVASCKLPDPKSSPYTDISRGTIQGFSIMQRHQRKVSLIDSSLMLARNRARHGYPYTSPTSRAQLLARGAGNRSRSHRSSGPDFTESSSVSTSSGGNAHTEDCLFHSTITSQSRVNDWQVQQPGGSSKYYTDDSDSLASAYLESRSSSTSRHNNTLHLKQPTLKWSQQQRVSPAVELNNLSHLRSTPQILPAHNNSPQTSRAPTIKAQSRASSVIKIDCPSQSKLKRDEGSLETMPVEQGHISCVEPDAEGTPNGFDLLIPDNVSMSDLCNAVAEPPKQLKLEQFLNQISNIINSPQHHVSPDSQTSTGKECDISNSSTGAATLQDNPPDSSVHRPINLSTTDEPLFNGDKVGNNAEEEDEDCKSHSSILDHLSSMALESMAKLNSRVGNQVVEEDSEPAPSGHLQRLLNSSQQQKTTPVSNTCSSHVILKDSLSIANHLRALRVNCHDSPDGHHDNSPSPASFVHSTTSSSSGFSSALTGSLDNAKCQPNTNNPPENLHTVTLTQPFETSNKKQGLQQEQDKMYASVVKAHCNVKS